MYFRETNPRGFLRTHFSKMHVFCLRQRFNLYICKASRSTSRPKKITIGILNCSSIMGSVCTDGIMGSNIKYHFYYHITNIMKQQHLNLSDENAIKNNPDNSYMHVSSNFWSLKLSKWKSHKFIKYACHSFITSVPFILLWILSSDISAHFFSAYNRSRF